MFVIQIRSNSGCDIRHVINITFVTCGRIAKRIDLSQDKKINSKSEVTL